MDVSTRPQSYTLQADQAVEQVPQPVILAVDDILENRELLYRRLDRNGFKVVLAESGIVALSVLEEQPIHLVLLDVMMPEMDGIEVLRRVREKYAYAELPVIMVTAKTDSSDVVEALNAGANDYVSKPIDFPVLYARVKTQLELKRAHDGLNLLNMDLERRVEARTADILQAQLALKRSSERYQQLYEDTPAMFYTVDIEGRLLSVNRFALSHLGYDKEEMVGHAFIEFCVRGNQCAVEDALSACFKDSNRVHAWEVQRLRRDGTSFWSRESARVVQDENGTEQALVVAEDITEAYRLSEELSYQATHDSLTDLVNRREFERRLQRVLVTAQAEETTNALLYLDLDQFKVVNDTCGHAAGDELLRQLSVVLVGNVRKRDTLARLGGDEFGVLMEHCSLEEAGRVAEDLRQSVEDFRFAWDGHNFGIGVSIGMVNIDCNSASLAKMLADADSACFMAKEMGRNQVHIFMQDDQELMRRRGEMSWHPRIQEALDNDNFVIYQQRIEPAGGMNSNGRCSYELLVRMRDYDGSHIPPGAFLPAAERYGLSPKLDRWIIRRVFEWLRDNPEYVAGLDHCAINLSGLSMGDKEMLPFLREQFDQTGLHAERICFEITETAAIYNLAVATRFIGELKEMGCYFALDDFGSGLSSFAYLKNLPVDYLKIDGMFVRNIMDDDIDFAMVRSINEIGKVMGKRTIAEFVENDAIRQRLHDIGVDLVQGYGVARPELLID